MSRTKIAPTLRALVDDPYADGLDCDAYIAELRALLAVASAAERVDAEGDEDFISAEAILRQRRALSRLRALSSPPSRRGSLRKGSTVEGNDTLSSNSRSRRVPGGRRTGGESAP